MRTELLGDDHPETLATRHNLAELYIVWNRPEAAQELLDTNIALMEKKSHSDAKATEAAMKENAKH